MKHSLKMGLLACVLALSACATNLIGKETQALQSVTAARQLSIASLQSKQITPDQNDKNKVYLDGLAASIKAAVAANNPPKVDELAKAATNFDPKKGQ